MGSKGHSDRGLGGSIHHYDSHGQKSGRSDPNFFGGYTNYDAHGNKIGRSEPGLFGGINHYDSRGNKTGHSEPGLFGGYNHYNIHENKTGHSEPGFPGSYNHSDGYYVATCVYGSYDCPEVWPLRRFRDHKLAATVSGRTFIRTYYAVSPGIVRCFGKRAAFRSFWKKRLDKLVFRLQSTGVASTPYADADWRK